jgi:THAP domain
VFTRFPANADIRAEWVRILHEGGRPDEWEPSNNTKICSLHFDLEQLKFNDKGTQIVKGANPNIPKTDVKKVILCEIFIEMLCGTIHATIIKTH